MFFYTWRWQALASAGCGPVLGGDCWLRRFSSLHRWCPRPAHTFLDLPQVHQRCCTDQAWREVFRKQCSMLISKSQCKRKKEEQCLIVFITTGSICILHQQGKLPFHAPFQTKDRAPTSQGLKTQGLTQVRWKGKGQRSHDLVSRTLGSRGRQSRAS